MVGVSKLYCGAVEAGDVLRYGRRAQDLPSHLLQFSADKKPVVVWNLTRRCNLACRHCYAQAGAAPAPDELSPAEGLALLQDLKDFGVPVVLFSGGEPLLRPDLLELVAWTVKAGMRAVISSNGTLITPEVARGLQGLGVSYVGISLDGNEETHDRFRGQRGAYAAALAGVRHCQEAGLKVGLRFTISRLNYREVPALFDLVEEYELPRVCFYHLVYAGRGTRLVEEAVSHADTRALVDLICARTRSLFERGRPVEVLTVDNHADGPYIYLKLLQEDPARAAEVLKLLKMNEGNNSGRGIGCVSWDGEVHADQFWRHYSFGNVRQRPFSQIWTDLSNPLMARLKDKKRYVTGRCARCQWLAVCAGNFRVRAEALTGDLWAPDPACYLTEEEIGGGGQGSQTPAPLPQTLTSNPLKGLFGAVKSALARLSGPPSAGWVGGGRNPGSTGVSPVLGPWPSPQNLFFSEISLSFLRKPETPNRPLTIPHFPALMGQASRSGTLTDGIGCLKTPD